jgi:hypothetical protein
MIAKRKRMRVATKMVSKSMTTARTGRSVRKTVAMTSSDTNTSRTATTSTTSSDRSGKTMTSLDTNMLRTMTKRNPTRTRNRTETVAVRSRAVSGSAATGPTDSCGSFVRWRHCRRLRAAPQARRRGQLRTRVRVSNPAKCRSSPRSGDTVRTASGATIAGCGGFLSVAQG